MNIYRLRDEQTTQITPWQQGSDFNPLIYGVPDGFILEVKTEEGWDVYRKTTVSELISSIENRNIEIIGLLQEQDDDIGQLKEML